MLIHTRTPIRISISFLERLQTLLRPIMGFVSSLCTGTVGAGG